MRIAEYFTLAEFLQGVGLSVRTVGTAIPLHDRGRTRQLTLCEVWACDVSYLSRVVRHIRIGSV